MSRCSIDRLADEIAKELTAYSQEAADAVKDRVKQTAKECRDELRQTSPRLTGDYRKGWAVKSNFESRQDIRQTVHNRTDWQLTHLLEYGHAGRGGTMAGAAKAYPHIEPAYETAAGKLAQRVKVKLGK